MITQYLVMAVYFIILFLIGIVAAKKINSIEDYYVGGKNLGYWVVAFSSRATGESAWLLLGLTGMGALLGVQAFWVVLGEVLGVTLCWQLMAKPFKRLTDKYNSVTIPDFLTSHFPDQKKILRIVSAFVLAVFVTIYVSAQIDATGTAFETFFNWNYFIGAIVGFAIVVAYIFTGGFVAVAWSDVFQGSMMFIGLVFMPIVAFFSLSKLNLAPALFDGLRAIDPGLLNIWGSGGFTLFNLMSIIGFLAIGIGFLGSPQVFVRFISVKNETELDKGKWVAIGYTILTDSAAVLIGMIGRYVLTKPGQDPVSLLSNGAQNVLPMLSESIFPNIIIAIYVAVILSAIMSTIDSLLVLASSAVTRDVYQQMLHPERTDESLTNFSRVVTLALAGVALAIAMAVAVYSPTRTIFWFVMFGWSGIASCFCPMMILSLSWKGYTGRGALASMISGFIAVPVFSFIVPTLSGIGPYVSELGTLPPSFAVSLLVGILVSLKEKKRTQTV